MNSSACALLGSLDVPPGADLSQRAGAQRAGALNRTIRRACFVVGLAATAWLAGSLASSASAGTPDQPAPHPISHLGSAASVIASPPAGTAGSALSSSAVRTVVAAGGSDRVVKVPEPAIVRAVTQVAKSVTPVAAAARPVGKGATPVVKAVTRVASIATPVATVVSPVATPVTATVGHVAVSAAKVAQVTAPVVTKVAAPLVEVVKPFARMIAPVVETVSTMIAPFTGRLTSIDNLLASVDPMISAVNSVVTPVLGSVDALTVPARSIIAPLLPIGPVPVNRAILAPILLNTGVTPSPVSANILVSGAVTSLLPVVAPLSAWPVDAGRAAAAALTTTALTIAGGLALAGFGGLATNALTIPGGAPSAGGSGGNRRTAAATARSAQTPSAPAPAPAAPLTPGITANGSGGDRSAADLPAASSVFQLTMLAVIAASEKARLNILAYRPSFSPD